MVQKDKIQAERTWLGGAIALGIGGAALIAATNAPRFCDPFLYIGVGFCVLAAWVLLGVFLTPRLLPKLPTERGAERFQRQIDEILIEGQGLYRRRVTSDAELATFKRDYGTWGVRTNRWLLSEASGSAADAFDHPTGMAAVISGSFNEEHNDLRLRLSWQLRQLRELAAV